MAWQARSIKDIRDSINYELDIIESYNGIFNSSNIESSIKTIRKDVEDLRAAETADTNTINDILDSVYDLRKTHKEVRE